MAMKVAFMAIVPGSDAEQHRSVLTTDFVELITLLVPDRDTAVAKAKQLVDEGCAAIELCGGFGHLGTAKIVEAVGTRPPSAWCASTSTRPWGARAATRYFNRHIDI